MFASSALYLLLIAPADGGPRQTFPATESWSEGLGWVRHEALVEGLEAGSRWRYRVQSGRRWSACASFSTAPALDSAVHLALIGDGNHEIASTPSPAPGPDAGDDVYYSDADTAVARFQDVVLHPDIGSTDPRDAER